MPRKTPSLLAALVIAATGIATAVAAPPVPSLGVNASLNGRRPFPDDNPWNTPIDRYPVDPASDVLINSIGRATSIHPDFGTVYEGRPSGIPYVVVPGNTPAARVTFEYPKESEPGPYPIPPNPPIEGGGMVEGDRHVLVIDRDHWKLYELYHVYPDVNGYKASSGAIFDLNSNTLRPDGWTSADAAGLPIFPGLVRYDEAVQARAIRHALRFTVRRSRHAYVYPARHFASRSSDPSLPPMGMRVRLKAGYDFSGFPPAAQVILAALKRYGMFLADNGGNWFISGAPDPRWNEGDLGTLRRVRGNDFEVVKMGPLTER